MKEFSGVKEIEKPLKNTIVTIGNFDGVHKGHQELLRIAIEKAGEKNGSSMAITFFPHPLKCIRPENHPPIITLHEQKKELMEKSGVDYLLTIPFSGEFSNLTAVEFIEDILIKKLGVSGIVVGKDYMFGKNRKGNIALLEEYGEKYGFQVFLPEWITFDDERISSTLVRKSVTEGRLKHAKSMLGRFYQIRGKVVHGRDRGGKKLGFPTANIDLVDELCPKMGVYAVTIELEGKTHDGVANIGYSPTFDDHKFTVEAHVLDFDKDLYGKDIRVNFIERLRGERKFSGLDELSSQIARDISQAREILSKI